MVCGTDRLPGDSMSLVPVPQARPVPAVCLTHVSPQLWSSLDTARQAHSPWLHGMVWHGLALMASQRSLLEAVKTDFLSCGLPLV